HPCGPAPGRPVAESFPAIGRRATCACQPIGYSPHPETPELAAPPRPPRNAQLTSLTSGQVSRTVADGRWGSVRSIQARSCLLVPKQEFGNAWLRNSVSLPDTVEGAKRSFARARSQTGVWEPEEV